jgi:molecular chaperone GrpE
MSEHDDKGPAADPAAAQPLPTAEQALADAVRAGGTHPAPAVPGEDVESAEEVAGEVVDELATPQPHAADELQDPPPAEEPDYRDLYLRASADMDNVRKRARRDVGAAEARGVGKLAKELLPAIDNLERALQAAEAEEGAGEHEITKGIRLVQAEFVGALTRVGIQIEDPKGQPFDPHRHEALAQTPVEGTPPGVVVEVYQPGYVHADAVLRAARVVVSS